MTLRALRVRVRLLHDAAWMADVPTDLEVEEVARLHLAEALRKAVG